MADPAVPYGDTNPIDSTVQILDAKDSQMFNVAVDLKKHMLAEKLYQFPENIKSRIRALKKLQLATTKIEAKFYAEIHALELKYHKQCSPYFEKRGTIVSGQYEPTKEECEWHLEETHELIGKIKNWPPADESAHNPLTNYSGIPDFWLTIFTNVDVLAALVQDRDEPVLKHLYDVKVVYQKTDPMGFILEFWFTTNEYFSNDVLTKQYILKCEPNVDDPFMFDGPEVINCICSTIDWYEGKDLTKMKILKTSKRKRRSGHSQFVKTVPNETFFNFFTTPEMPLDDDDEEMEALMLEDFDVANYIRERIIPRAILYYTGEGIDETDDSEDDESTLSERSDEVANQEEVVGSTVDQTA